MPETLNLVTVDDHSVVREGFAAMLRLRGFFTAQKFAGGVEALAQIPGCNADIVLLDVRLPDVDGLSVLERLVQQNPDCCVVMLTGHSNWTYVARAVACGARDYLEKSASISQIARALRLAAQGIERDDAGLFGSMKTMMNASIDPSMLPAEMPLTSREAQVLRHMGLGLSNREVAGSLKISIETVKEHVQNVLRKLGANDRTHAAVQAVKAGLVQCE